MFLYLKNFKSKLRFSKAFTLIELLVVITIIAIIGGLGLARYNAVRDKALDKRVKDDLGAVSEALVAYYIDKGDYPQPSGGEVNSKYGYWMNDLVLEGYLSESPKDPRQAAIGSFLATIPSPASTIKPIAAEISDLLSPIFKRSNSQPEVAGTFSQKINASANDAQQNQDGTFFQTGAIWNSVVSGTTGRGDSGLRWTNVTIPPGATITSAKISAKAIYGGTQVAADVYGELTKNPQDFVTNQTVVGRTKTSTFVPWIQTLPDGVYTQSNVDIAPVIQQIINSTPGGWSSGDSLVLILKGKNQPTSSTATLESYDNNSGLDAPTLDITYTTTPACSPVSQSVGIGQNATLNASGGDGSYSWNATAGSGNPSSGSGPTFNVNYPATGTFNVVLTSAGQNANCSVTVYDATPQNYNSQITAGINDANQRSDGANFSSSNLTITIQASSLPIFGGFRYTSVAIPQGATISNAYMEFKAPNTFFDDFHIDFFAEAADNAQDFVASPTISGRTLTTANTSWVKDSAGTGFVATDPITPVIQEVINRPGWVSGNSLVIVAKGKTQAQNKFGQTHAYETNPANTPKLHITFTYIPPPETFCSPESQQVEVNNQASFSASGGNGTYIWVAPGGSPSGGSGSNFASTYPTEGEYQVEVQAGSNDFCNVTVVPPPPPPPKACQDGVDNDGDGKIDFGKDPGCDSPTDDDEDDATNPPPEGSGTLTGVAEKVYGYGYFPNSGNPYFILWGVIEDSGDSETIENGGNKRCNETIPPANSIFNYCLDSRFLFD